MSQSCALKTVLIAAPCFLLFAASSQGADGSRLADPNATVAAPLPVPAYALQSKLAPLAPSVSNWIEAEARGLLARNLPADGMIQVAWADVLARFAGQLNTRADVATVVQLVLSAAAADAQNDVGNVRASLQAGKTDQLSDMSSQDQLGLQMFMDRSNNAQLALSNIMRQTADAQSTITSNLK